MHVLFTALLSEGSIIDLDGTIWVQLGLFAVAFLLFRPLIFRPMVALFEAREKALIPRLREVAACPGFAASLAATRRIWPMVCRSASELPTISRETIGESPTAQGRISSTNRGSPSSVSGIGNAVTS